MRLEKVDFYEVRTYCFRQNSRKLPKNLPSFLFFALAYRGYTRYNRDNPNIGGTLMDKMNCETFIAMLTRLVGGYEKKPVCIDGVSAEDFAGQVCEALKDYFEGLFYLRADHTLVCHLVTGEEFEIRVSGV